MSVSSQIRKLAKSIQALTFEEEEILDGINDRQVIKDVNRGLSKFVRDLKSGRGKYFDAVGTDADTWIKILSRPRVVVEDKYFQHGDLVIDVTVNGGTFMLEAVNPNSTKYSDYVEEAIWNKIIEYGPGEYGG